MYEEYYATLRGVAHDEYLNSLDNLRRTAEHVRKYDASPAALELLREQLREFHKLLFRWLPEREQDRVVDNIIQNVLSEFIQSTVTPTVVAKVVGLGAVGAVGTFIQMVLKRVAEFHSAHDLQKRNVQNRVAEAAALGLNILQQQQQPLQQLRQWGEQLLEHVGQQAGRVGR